MILSTIIKYTILFTTATVLTLITVYIPVEGIDLLGFSDIECEWRAAGLPVAFTSKIMDDRVTKRLTESLKLPPRCHEPQPQVASRFGDVLKRLTATSLSFTIDVIFWTAVLYIITTLFTKPRNYIRSKMSS